MSAIAELVQRELIDVDNESKNVKDFFHHVASELEGWGYVQETFFEAIYEREQEYPTGLELPDITIAIPHTDVEHIKKPFIYVNRMKTKSIEFIQMGTDDVYVKPEYIIVLGIKDPKEQVGLLSTIMELFSSEKFIEELNQAQNENQIYNLLNNK